MQAKHHRALSPTLVVHAALIWILLAAMEAVANFYLQQPPAGVTYYQATLFLTCIACIATLRLGAARLARDVQELCLYDIFLQIFGLLTYVPNQKPTLYFALAQIIIILKMTRLGWPIFHFLIGLPANWPRFGLITFLTTSKEDIDQWQPAQKWKMWLFLLLLPFLSFAIQQAWLKADIPLPSFIIIVAILAGSRRIVGDLAARDAALEAAIIAEADAKHRASLAQIELANKAALEAKNKELVAALKERDQANTELASKNTALASANAALEALSQERAVLARDLATRNERLADATHDIQQPLMFLGYKANEMLASAITEEQRTIAQDLKDELRGLGDRMVRITAEAQTGEMPPPPTLNLPVAELRSYFFERFNSLALDHEVTLKCLIKPDWNANFALQSNGDLLKRVIGNLLYNAITYAEESDWVFLIFHRCGNECFVRIWDTGQGIGDFDSPDRAANFRALLASTNPDTPPEADTQEPDPVAVGHGIGLHSVQRLCEQLGISMTLRARIDQGTLFRFKLPVV
jgi:signal transduction histidine kinase